MGAPASNDGLLREIVLAYVAGDYARALTLAWRAEVETPKGAFDLLQQSLLLAPRREITLAHLVIRGCQDLANRCLEPPLSQQLVRAITKDPKTAPVFFTISQQDRKLRGKLEAKPEYLESLRSSAEKWLLEPDQLAIDEGQRFEDQLKKEGLAPKLGWEVLRLLSDAREDMKPDVLKALVQAARFVPDPKLRDPLQKKKESEWIQQIDAFREFVREHVEDVLKFAANFFKPRAVPADPDEPFTYGHPSLQRYVSEVMVRKDDPRSRGARNRGEVAGQPPGR